MKKFLVLYRAPKAALAAMAKATPAQAKAGMDAWMAWSKKAGKSIVELGAPLGATKTYDAKGAKAVRASGAIGGYSIMQGKSIAEIGKSMKGHPHFMMRGGSIEILELLPM